MKKTNVVSLILLTVLVVIGVYAFMGKDRVESSVGPTGEYYATTTVGMASGTAQMMVQVFTGSGVLGSIVIGSTTQYTLNVWDSATSTSASSTDPVNASTTPVKLAASSANGTYTYDIVIEKGLVIQLPAAFNGAYTITYRRQ